MNDTQHRARGRLADFSPFDIRVTVEAPKPSARMRSAGYREFLKGRAETDATYGCVDWYQYPDRSRGVRGSAVESTHNF
jgi:hypothetical protein